MKRRIMVAITMAIIITALILTLTPLALNADTFKKSYSASYDDAFGTYYWTNPDGNNINSVHMELFCWMCMHVDWEGTFTQDGNMEAWMTLGTVSGIGTPNIKIVMYDNGENYLYTLNVTYSSDVWIRDREMACYRVWINEDNKFQFSFIYPYANNNWVKIYDMSGKEVFSIDMPYDNPNLIVDLPNGLYTVKTFTVGSTEPIQTFVIGK